ncbi:cytochrome P450 family protein [Amycolatopsis sp. NPDC004368]
MGQVAARSGGFRDTTLARLIASNGKGWTMTMENDPFTARVDGARPALLAELTAAGPVHHRMLPTGVPAWVVTGYAEARAALTDPRLIKGGPEHSPFAKELPDQAAALHQHMLSQDPPVHTRLRKLVSRAFTRHRIESLAPRIEQICRERLDSLTAELATRGEADLITGYALPVPFTVICELVGVPQEEHHVLHDAWAAQAAGSIIGVEKYAEASDRVIAFVRDLISTKRRRLGDDLLSELISVRDAQGGLTQNELTSMTYLLILAGHETTASLIGNGARALLLNPDQRVLLKSEPGLLAAAVEEILRYDSPSQLAIPTIAAAPIELAGNSVAEGEVVVVSLLGANHDPAVVSDPAHFDIRRRSPHLAFGHGIHHCLGAPLARLEGKIALRALFDRLPELELAVHPDSLRREPSLLFNKLATLPVREGTVAAV